MAIDEALSSSVHLAPETGFLRFYKWQPATLSFGYNQRIEKIINVSLLPDYNISAVKRVTGGKMVFHDDELTFSMGFHIPSIEHKLPSRYKFIDVFLCIMEPLLQGLRQLDMSVRFADSHEMNRKSHNRIHCYAAAAGHSVFVNGKKMIGAAGVIKNDCISIHGSIPITISEPPTELFLNNENPNKELEIATLSDFLSENEIKTIPNHVCESFREFFSVPLENDKLTTNENTMVTQLVREKYSDLNWKRNKT